jgi:hypothetical protein
MRLRTKAAIVSGAALLASGVAAGVGFSSRPSSPVPMCDAYPAKGQEPCSDQIERLRRQGFDCVLGREGGDNILTCSPQP